MVGMAVGASVADPVGSSTVKIGVVVGSKTDRIGVGERASVEGDAVGLRRRMSAVGVAVATTVGSGCCSVGAGVGSGGVAGGVSWLVLCGSKGTVSVIVVEISCTIPGGPCRLINASSGLGVARRVSLDLRTNTRCWNCIMGNCGLINSNGGDCKARPVFCAPRMVAVV